MAGNISGVAAQKIAHKLVYRVVALFLQRSINLADSLGYVFLSSVRLNIMVSLEMLITIPPLKIKRLFIYFNIP